MSTYQLTPAERRARAQALVESRRNRSLYNNYLKEKAIYEKQLEEERLKSVWEENDRNSQNFLVRGLSTVGDVVANVLTGAVKGLEGIVDLGIGLVGAVGGIFDGDFQNRVKDVIAYDWTGETFGNALQEALKYSYTTNGGIIESVASGIGQMLPAVVVSIATAGAGAPAAIAQAASLATLGVSAAGTSTEDAFQEGADYWAGLGYGVASGLVEVATEKMFGGATKALTGAGIFDGVTKSVADTGLKRIAKNVIEEGVEEVVAELANPALKSIYKGKDAFKEYGEGEYWKGVGKAGLVGSLTALAYSGSVGYGLSKVGVGYVGKEADIADSLNEISQLKEKANNLQSNGELTEVNEQKIADTTRKNYQNIEKVLQSLSEEKRARYIEKFNLGKAFNADGTMSEQLSSWFNAGQAEGGENSAQSELASPKKDYYSFNLRGNEQSIGEDLNAISEDRAKAYLEEQKKEGKDITIEQAREHVGEFKVFSEEMTEKASESFKKFKKGLNYLNKVSNGNVAFVVTEANETFNGLLKDGKLYIGEDAFETDNWAGTLVHEYTHFAEGTEEYNQYVNFISSDENLLEKAESVVQKTYGFDTKKLDAILEKAKNGAEISEAEAKYFESYRTEVAAHQSEYLLGNEEFIDRLVLHEANLAQKVIQKIQSLKKMFSKVDGKLTRAEHKRLIRAEKLYLKAASKAGNMQLVKMILAQNPDLAEEIDNSGEIRYNKKGQYIQISKQEYAILSSRIMEDNSGIVAKGGEVERYDTARSANYFYVYENFSEGSFGVLKQIPLTDDNINYIKAIETQIGETNGESIIRSTSELNRVLKVLKSKSRVNSGNNVDDSGRRADSGNGELSVGESESKRIGDSQKSDGNQQIRYSLKDTVESDVVKEYGKTYRWSETGYILKDGTRLDLSGRNEGAPGGYRSIDHRDIFSSYEGIDRTEAMIEFMERGNIRVSPEYPGINLQVEPTEEQYRQIGEMVEKLGWKEKYFSVDFDDKNGNTIDTLSYEGNVSFRKVISDIRYYFKEGKVPYQSELSKFRYSLKEETPQALEYEQTIKYSLVKDKDTLDFLNNQKHIKVYRAMQIIDGKLYPPMAAKINENGKSVFVEPTILGEWYRADERPNLVKNGKFILNKGNGSSISAAYNPYWHTSKSPLNDQFSSAYKRSNLVTVECEVPESELTSGYKAEGAKDSVGEVVWHSGQVSSKLNGDKARKVILSRWIKVNRTVSDSEVASSIAKLLEGENISIPDNTITPSLREELEKLGVSIEKSGKIQQYSLKQDSEGKELSEGQKRFFKDSKVLDDNGNLLVVYHSTNNYEEKSTWNNHLKSWDTEYTPFTIFKTQYDEQAGHFFGKDINNAGGYGNRIYKVYLNLIKPLTIDCKGSSYADIELNKMHKDTYEWAIWAKQKGYDGVIFKNIRDGVDYGAMQDTTDEYVAFKSNQIKLTDNLNPTENEDIRYSLKSADKYFYELTDGQVKKLLADKTKMKVYSKVEAEQVINTILDNSLGIGEKYGKLVGKSKAEVIEMLWRGLNTAEPGKQMHVALDIAEYIIQNSVLENLYEDSENDVYMDTISVLKPHLHSLDLSSIKGEIKYHYDTDNSPYLIWGKRKGDSGIAPDQLKPILEESGFYIDTDVGADIFFRIDEAYREAVNALKKKSKELLKSALSDDERKALKNKIAREVLLAFDENGKPSQFAKILDEYGKQAKFWKEKFYDEKIRGKARDSLFEAVDRVKGLEKYQRADVKLADEVLGLVKLLKKIKTYRGNISKNVRQIMLEYSKEVNGKKLYELLSNNTEGETNPFAEDIERIAHANGELSTQEIRALDAIIRNFIHNVNEYDRVFFEGRSQSETEVATTAINETRRTVKISDSGAKGLIRRYINYTTNPVNRFRRLGNYSNDSIIARIYAELQKGANKQSLFKQKVDALFDDFMKAHKKEIAAYDKQDIEIGGVKMSKGQMISLYLTFLRQQGRSHLFGEGDEGVIRLSNEKAKKQGLKESYNKGEDVKISRATIEEIQSKFTQTDKEFILLAQKFFNGEEYSKGAITETQEALYGVAMVEDDFYFPLRVADDQIYKEIGNDSLKDLFTVYSPSFTKAVREGANNKVVIENVLDVIKRHSNQMAAYYGLAQPIRTFNRLLNKKVEGANLRSVITSVDSSFIDYANKLLGDLQGSNARRGTFDRVVGKIRSWGARAALGANPKVWVNQVVSLPAANAVGLNYKNLVKGFGKALTFKTDFESLFKYSPLAYERFRNGSNLDVGLLYEEKSFGGKLNKITDITTAPIQAFDKFTIGAIWNAALEQTKSKEYQDYSEDHYKKAAELTEKAITETQPNYTVLQRPEILRADSELIRLGTMFMTQPLQNLSLLASGIDKYLVSKKQLSLFAEGTEEYKKAKAQYEEAKKELWHKSSAVVVETTMLVLVAELFKMLLGKDDDKEFGERVLGDYLDSVIGMFPIIKDGYSLFQGYDISNMYYTGYTNIVEGVKDLYSVVELLASGKNYDQTTINSKVRKTLLGLSQTFGIPLRNIENYIKGIVGNISPATRLKYESNFTSQSTKALTEKLKTAIDKGDDDLADTVVGIMLDEKGFGVEDSTVRKEIKTLTVNGYNVLPKGVGNSITYDGEEIALTKGQAKAFKEIYSTANEALASLVKLSQYESATDEVKAKAINFIYNVYYNLALQDLLGEDLETKTVLFAEAIDVEKLAIIVATANSLKADVDKKGNVITGTRKKKIQTYINSLKLSAAQKYMIMGYLGFKNLKGETQVKAYINRLKLTKTEKEKLLQYSGYSK